MNQVDYVFIDMAETSIKALSATVCIIALREPQAHGYAIQAACPVKRLEPLRLKLVMNSFYRAYVEDGGSNGAEAPLVIRDPQLLRSVSQVLSLPETLLSALQIPLCINEQLMGFLIFGEVRKWDRAPFSRERIRRAMKQADRVLDYLERKYTKPTK